MKEMKGGIGGVLLILGVSVGPGASRIIFLANMELGYMTPPVGLNLLMSSFRFRKPVSEVLRAVFPVIALLSGGLDYVRPSADDGVAGIVWFLSLGPRP